MCLVYARPFTLPLVADRLAGLLRDPIAELVLEYSPQEKHLADKWRLPVAGE